jgi:hypothetical protein
MAIFGERTVSERKRPVRETVHPDELSPEEGARFCAAIALVCVALPDVEGVGARDGNQAQHVAAGGDTEAQGSGRGACDASSARCWPAGREPSRRTVARAGCRGSAQSAGVADLRPSSDASRAVNTMWHGLTMDRHYAYNGRRGSKATEGKERAKGAGGEGSCNSLREEGLDIGGKEGGPRRKQLASLDRTRRGGDERGHLSLLFETCGEPPGACGGRSIVCFHRWWQPLGVERTTSRK